MHVPMNIMRSPNEQAEVEALWKEEELKQLSQLDLAKEIAIFLFNWTIFLFNWAIFLFNFPIQLGIFPFQLG